MQWQLLSIHGQPLSVAPHENVGESGSVRFGSGIMNSADDSCSNRNISVDTHSQLLEVLASGKRIRMLAQESQLVFFIDKPDREHMDEVVRQDRLHHIRAIFIF